MKTVSLAIVLATVAVISGPVFAAADMQCRLQFNLKGWSAFYKTAEGSGVVTCANGARARVRLRVKGGGLSVGTTTIDNGQGTFSRVYSINEIFGDYIAAEAHAGAGNSAQAAVYTRGEVSLALTGKGRGVNVGIDFGKLSITRAGN